MELLRPYTNKNRFPLLDLYLCKTDLKEYFGGRPILQRLGKLMDSASRPTETIPNKNRIASLITNILASKLKQKYPS
jgi:hypothetical protein